MYAFCAVGISVPIGRVKANTFTEGFLFLLPDVLSEHLEERGKVNVINLRICDLTFNNAIGQHFLTFSLLRQRKSNKKKGDFFRKAPPEKKGSTHISLALIIRVGLVFGSVAFAIGPTKSY